MFNGYILTGGKSARMGEDKAFLEFNGETFLNRAVSALAPDCAEIKIVLNKNQTHFIENLPLNTSYITDVYENRGALGGIHAALKDCQTKFAVILAVDLPFVISQTINKLTKFALSSNKFPAFVPRQTDERPQPLCAVYRPNYCLPILENLLNRNDSASARNFLDLIMPQYILQKHLGDDENLFFNVNRTIDYQQLLKNKPAARNP